MTNLNIYYSAACNMKCEYCCMPQPEYDNSAIRSSIISGQFYNNIIRRFGNDAPVTLGIWGMEPSINQDLFGQFIIPLLEHFQSVKGIFVSTNGILFNYQDWAEPIRQFCIDNQRKIKLWIQFSIDGPDYPQIATNNLLNCIQSYITNEYFRIKLSTKSTLNKQSIYQDIDKWYSNMSALHDICERHSKIGCDISLVGNAPTFERPGEWTPEDGRRWAEWHVHIPTDKIYNCSAGINSFTIIYTGQVYNCQMCSNYIPELEPLYENKSVELIYNRLFESKLITETNKEKLINAVSYVHCRAQNNIYNNTCPTEVGIIRDALDTYFIMLGNGALQEDV